MARTMRAHLSRTTPSLVVSVLVLSSLLMLGAPAHACSCATVGVRGALDQHDGAFVGRWNDRSEIGSGFAAVTFEVERVVKGSFGPKAIVRTNAQGSACGLELLGTPRIGLLLDRTGDGVWGSNLCSILKPSELLAVARGHPPDPAIASVSPGWSTTAKVVGVGVLVLALALLVAWGLAWRASRTTSRGVT